MLNKIDRTEIIKAKRVQKELKGLPLLKECNATFEIDDDELNIYIEGYYTACVRIIDLSLEARFEIGLDREYKGYE